MTTRRTFLKIALGTALAVAAKVYVPAAARDVEVGYNPSEYPHWTNYTCTYPPQDQKALIEQMRKAMEEVRMMAPVVPQRPPYRFYTDYETARSLEKALWRSKQVSRLKRLLTLS